MENFKVGDVVYLKSGSPKMTVIFYEKSLGTACTVTWIDNEGHKQEEDFPSEVLTKVNPVEEIIDSK